MANVYISFLGTNDYLPALYYDSDSRELSEDQKKTGVRFVQEATLSFHCKNWSETDRILIFTTDEAETKNWVNDGHKDKDGKTPERTGLKECIDNLNLRCPAKNIRIPSGKSEEEIWEIFRLVLEQIDPEDAIVFDITHAFRSIPMLAIVLLNYSKVARDVRLKGIYYGAFEVIGSYFEAKNMKLEERRVPIFDLSVFDTLLDWAFAIDRFLGSGDAAPAHALASEKIRLLLKASKGGDQAAQSMEKVTKCLLSFTKILSTCRGRDIPAAVSSLKEAINQCREHEQLRPLQPLVDKVRDQVSKFQGDTIELGIQSAAWCFEHNLIQQAYTILQETLITYFIRGAGEDPDDFSKENRDIVNQAISIFQRTIPVEEWIDPAQSNPEKVEKYLSFFRGREDLIKIYRNLSNYRNDLNHAGMREGFMEPVRLESKFKEILENLKLD